MGPIGDHGLQEYAASGYALAVNTVRVVRKNGATSSWSMKPTGRHPRRELPDGADDFRLDPPNGLLIGIDQSVRRHATQTMAFPMNSTEQRTLPGWLRE